MERTPYRSDHPAYTHNEDEQLRSELRTILKGLPADHPAIIALNQGWATMVVVQHLSWADDKALRDDIMRAYEEWKRRCRQPA